MPYGIQEHGAFVDVGIDVGDIAEARDRRGREPQQQWTVDPKGGRGPR